MAAMFPGLSPIYIDPAGTETNVPPPGNTPGWALVARPSQIQPVIAANLLGTEIIHGGCEYEAPGDTNGGGELRRLRAATPSKPIHPPTPPPQPPEPKKEEPKKEEEKKHSIFGHKK